MTPTSSQQLDCADERRACKADNYDDRTQQLDAGGLQFHASLEVSESITLATDIVMRSCWQGTPQRKRDSAAVNNPQAPTVL
jgi:hypothetical protein